MLACLSVWNEVQNVCMWSCRCYCHPKTASSLATVKSRMFLPFWYWFIQVVLENSLFNGCLFVCSKCFKQKLASLQLETEPFEVEHYMLLLTLLSADCESDGLLLELYSLAHSQPARLYVLMKLNRTLRELLFRLIGLDDEVSRAVSS